MTVGQFEQLVGAAGDVAELEYVAALHQTRELRRDASLQANDIRLFLSSRYGIKVAEKEVLETIMDGLAGGEERVGDGDVLDLMEIVTCLFIPTLLKAAQQHNGIPLPTNVVPANSKLLSTVWNILLNDATGSEEPKRLSNDLIKRLLIAYGETALAEDEKLVETMLQACKTKNEKAEYFTLDVFADALTEDVQLYDLRNEVCHTTDVLLTHKSSGVQTVTDKFTATERGDQSKLSERLAMSRPLNLVHTLPQIDITAENYRSKVLIICLWANFLISYFTYVYSNTRAERFCWADESFVYESTNTWAKNGLSIMCAISTSVFSWIFTFFGMAIAGVVSMLLGSIGNSMDCRRWTMPAIGAVLVLSFQIIPYTNNSSADSKTYLKNVSLALGVVAASYHLSHVAAMVLPPGLLKRIPRLTRSTEFAEIKLKKCAAMKIIGMAENALDILEEKECDKDNLFQTHYGKALQAYAKRGKQFVTAGGFLWSWKRIIGEESLATDGIWIPVRFLASNIAQYIVSLWVLITGIKLTQTIAENYRDGTAKVTFESILNKTIDTGVDEGVAEEAIANMTKLIRSFLVSNQSQFDINCNNFSGTAASVFDDNCEETNSTFLCNVTTGINYLCPLVQDSDLDYRQQLAFLQAAGLDSETLAQSLKEIANKASDTAINSLYPTELYMVLIPAAVATALAFATAVYLASSYLPSVVNTILKLRCGAIPTLRDPRYAQYRVAPDQVSILTGSLFWGALVSSIVVGGFFGIVVFFFLWQATAYYAHRCVAFACGLVLISVLRFIILQTQRRRLFKSFYRERPGAANLLLLGLEWATFTLTAGFIFVRMVKLLLCAGACIGRIDTPFLAPGIGRIGPIELDVYPTVHLKDILIHEAHRHPYMESLGVIYLLKLRYGENFGSRAGSCWRLLFVYALMPWLHKYRISARPSILQTINEEESPGEADSPRSMIKNMASQKLLQVTEDDELNDGDGDFLSEMSSIELLPWQTHRAEAKVLDLEKEVRRLQKELHRLSLPEEATGVSTSPITQVAL